MTRWTDLTTRQETTIHRTAGGMTAHRGLVIHTASGYYEGTISWQKDGSPATSSHFVISKGGAIAQMMDTADRSWAQAAGNNDWLSTENEGFGGQGGESLTPAQVTANARILAKAHLVYGIPLQLAASPSGSGLGHHAMGGAAWGGHFDCPGPPIIAQKPAILAQAIAILNGDDMLVDDPDGKYLFPRVEAMALLQQPGEGPEAHHDLPFVTALAEIRTNAAVAATRAVPVSMSQADRDAIVAGLAALVPTAAQIATAVLDEQHKRDAA